MRLESRLADFLFELCIKLLFMLERMQIDAKPYILVFLQTCESLGDRPVLQRQDVQIVVQGGKNDRLAPGGKFHTGKHDMIRRHRKIPLVETFNHSVAQMRPQCNSLSAEFFI
jgi:hypothetical protein